MTDELELVREYFGEQPPPEPRVAAAAKAQLPLAEQGSRAARPWRRQLVGGWRPSRRLAGEWRPSRQTLLRAGLPAVAAAAAVAVAVVVAVQGSSPAPVLGSSGRQILLTAARQVARVAQPVTGRYWVTAGTVGNYLKVGPADRPYLMLEQVGVQYWAARSPHGRSPYLYQPLWVRPASPSDQAAWRHDGSPTQWKDIGQDGGLADPYGESGNGGLIPLSTAPGKPADISAAYGSPPFLVGDRALSLRQLRALPADPATLKKLLMRGASHYERVSQSAYLLEVVPPVLQMPVTPAVRSALYRMLAAAPGIRSLGTIKDVSGTPGAAVAYTGKYTNCGNGIPLHGNGTSLFRVRFATCTVQQILVINPATGLPQAEELRYTQSPPGQNWTAPDRLFSYEIFSQSHWTNQNPPRG